jgi:hypothetical protein
VGPIQVGACSLSERKGAAVTNVFETYGIIRPDGTLEVAHKLAVPPGPVKVRVESMEALAMPQETMVEFVERSRRELAAAGHKFMNDEEVTAWIEELRDGSDDDRIDEIYRQAEEEKRAGSVSP